jgi:adenylate cyclase class 2
MVRRYKMDREIEVKIRINKEEEEKVLRTLLEKCIKKSTVNQFDEYYNHPCRDFSLTDEALRIRMESLEDEYSRTFITYKGPRAEGLYKEREEITVEIPCSQTGSIKKILERNGYRTVAIVKKKRTYFDCGDVEVSVDNVSGLGLFVEIELKRGFPDVIQDFMKKMGLGGTIEEKTYLEMILGKLEEKDSIEP